LWATRVLIQRGRKGDVGRGVEIEAGGEAVLGGDVNVGSGLVGVVEVGLPLLGMEEIAGSDAENGEESVGGVAVDDAGGDGLGQLGERGVDVVHGIERRQVEGEAFAAGAVLGGAEAAGAIAKMVDAVALSFDGEGLAEAAGVVDVVASVRHECLLIALAASNE